MRKFSYSRPDTVAGAVAALAGDPDAALVAGGTNLVDLMRKGVASPGRLIDVSRLSLDGVEELEDGGVRVGALVRNRDMAEHPLVAERYPMLSSALLQGASAQLRNAATTGGNLLQRTRCGYFNDATSPCNKREPGSGCSALEGYNRMHAILGASNQCIATHPSDMAVALSALDAVVRVEGPNGEREIPLTGFHRLPDDEPERDTVLERDELVTAVDIPPLDFATNSSYLKVRDRASYAFALVSVAAALDVSGGRIRGARLALGGVAHKPWRATEAEKVLVNARAGEDTYRRAAEAVVDAAEPREHNAFKVDLARRAIVRTLNQLGGTS